MEGLPQEILEKALVNLDGKDVARCRAVNSGWNELLHSADFLKSWRDDTFHEQETMIYYRICSLNGDFIGYRCWNPLSGSITASRVPVPENWRTIAGCDGLVVGVAKKNDRWDMYVGNPLHGTWDKLPRLYIPAKMKEKEDEGEKEAEEERGDPREQQNGYKKDSMVGGFLSNNDNNISKSDHNHEARECKEKTSNEKGATEDASDEYWISRHESVPLATKSFYTVKHPKHGHIGIGVLAKHPRTENYEIFGFGLWRGKELESYEDGEPFHEDVDWTLVSYIKTKEGFGAEVAEAFKKTLFGSFMGAHFGRFSAIWTTDAKKYISGMVPIVVVDNETWEWKLAEEKIEQGQAVEDILVWAPEL